MTTSEYIALLLRHDWQYGFSDDPRVWRQGNEEMERLRVHREAFDKSYAIWNKYAPLERQLKPFKE